MGADGEPVQLYIYDLSNGLAATWGRSLTGQDVEGIWCVLFCLTDRCGCLSYQSAERCSSRRHTSLVLHGMEVFFGQGVSIVSPPGTTHVSSPPLAHPASAMRLRMDKELIRLVLQHGVPKKKLSCGITHLDKETFLEYIDNLRETYRADAYHLLSFNCKS